MRITSGIYGGRQLHLPKGKDIRPTSDKVRQAVFNMLESRGLINEASVIDAFCGTGALGLEALSRGASFCTFIDKNQTSLSLCEKNIALLDAQEKSRTLKADSSKLPIQLHDTPPASLIFLDPPYNKDLIPPTIETLNNHDWLAEKCHFLIETAKNETLSFEDNFELIIEKNYKDTKIILLKYEA